MREVSEVMIKQSLFQDEVFRSSKSHNHILVLQKAFCRAAPISAALEWLNAGSLLVRKI